jgi:transposase
MSARIFYRARNLLEGFFNKIRQCRQLVKRRDKLAAKRPGFRPARIDTVVAAR